MINTIKIIAYSFALLLTGCFLNTSTYQIEMALHSEKGYGIKLYDLPVIKGTPYYRAVDPNDSHSIPIYPSAPVHYDSLTYLPPFKAHRGRKLPKEITFKYQYFNLSGCKYVYKYKPSRDLNTTAPDLKINKQGFYFDKSKCTKWEPLDGVIHTKTIDLRSYNESQEMKNMGKRSPSGKKYALSIYFHFLDDASIQVRLENSVKNVW